MRRWIPLAAAAVALAGVVAATTAEGYQVTVVLPSADNLVEGGTVEMKGFPAGSIEAIEPVDGKARLTLALDSEHAPLHSGAVVNVRWKALVGERRLTITDGKAGNAEIPGGGTIAGNMAQPVEFDRVFAALDAPTRKRVNSLVSRLRTTLRGSERDLQDTITAAGPALAATGDVLRGLGADRAAIKDLVGQAGELVDVLTARDDDLAAIVTQLSAASSAVADEHENLGKSLQRLPSTLRTARTTLGLVPGVVDEAEPLLRDLRPAAARLPRVAANTDAVLKDLRPTVARLRPALASANTLLRYTPGLLDSAHDVLPGATDLVRDLLPAVDFLRPYTPEAAGMLANWGSAMGNYGGAGYYVRVNPAGAGAHALTVNPGVMPPGYEARPQPAPGELVGQPWTDATGGGVR